MASYFSANQYENEFKANHLGNWEVPKWHPARPIQRKTTTKVIANDRGHLLPNINRPKTSPWGNFKGTWDLPDRITKELAVELHSPIVGSSRWNKPSEKPRSKKHTEYIEEQDCNKRQKDLSYVPGNLTNQDQRHHSHHHLVRSKHRKCPSLCDDRTFCENELYVEKHNNCTDELALLEEEDKRHRNHNKTEHILCEIKKPENSDEKMRHEVTDKPGEINTIPLIPASCNFHTAKKMAQENLEHQPLPDCITDNAYRRWQAQGVSNPELALDVSPVATGVGVRTHNAGPTHCTKMKVYRPKTCGVLSRSTENINAYLRPQTALISKSMLGPMDLAIGWDYRPADPRDEPKPPPHIDGSNGSAAPAVFTLVKTPKTAENENTGRSAGIFSNTLGQEGFFDKDIMHRKKQYFSTLLNDKTDSKCRCRNSAPAHLTRNRDNGQVRSTSTPNLSNIAQASSQSDRPDSILVCNYSKEHYHYRPVSHHHHHHHHNEPKLGDKNARVKEYLCGKSKPVKIHRMCEQNLSHTINRPEIKPKPKCPFKAGIPNSNSAGTCTSFDSGCSTSTTTASEYTSKTIKIPKPKDPYAKKNYVIDTLAPPFACWKGGAGQGGYPEHWRLSSVYQQAYKPIEQRKRPLLATVFQ